MAIFKINPLQSSLSSPFSFLKRGFQNIRQMGQSGKGISLTPNSRPQNVGGGNLLSQSLLSQPNLLPFQIQQPQNISQQQPPQIPPQQGINLQNIPIGQQSIPPTRQNIPTQSLQQQIPEIPITSQQLPTIQPEQPIIPTPTQEMPTIQSVTGNPQIDALIQNLPQIQKALGIGIETPEQTTFRKQQETGLNRLIALQEQLAQAQAPTGTLTELDKIIQEQSKALRETSPERLFATTPQFQAAGITQEQLQREAGARRAPIAQALSDLLTSRSILAQQQEAQRGAIEQQFGAIQNVLGLQQAMQALQPQRGIAPQVQEALLGGVVQQALVSPQERQRADLQIQLLETQLSQEKDPINRQIKVAQLAQTQVNIAKTLQESQATGNIRQIGTSLFLPNTDLTNEQKQKVQAYESGIMLVDQAERQYKEAVGGEVSGAFGGLLARIKGVGRTVAPVITDTKFKIYQNWLDSNKAVIAKGLKGQTGALTEREQADALKSFPGKFSSPKEAEAAFNNIREQITNDLSTMGEFDKKPSFVSLESEFNKFIK